MLHTLTSSIKIRYFTTNKKFSDKSKSVFSKSHHPVFWYSFAICGINISSWVYKWLLDGNLKTHYFNNFNTESDENIVTDFENEREEVLNHEEQKFLNYFNHVYSELTMANCRSGLYSAFVYRLPRHSFYRVRSVLVCQ
jgi:hypothetical protein